MTGNRVAFAPGVFTWPADAPQLIGGRCDACGAVVFPVAPSCARCGEPGMAEHRLPRRGTLWTWTTQDFLPKEPYASGETFETFTPYGVGLVQLGDDVRVEGRLTEADPAKLRIGMAVELVVVPFRVDDDGTEVMVYAFAPVEEQ
ncbi:MAG TPA: Zn-ribbon domain-containing OB-fold protein [Acidimicrobiia bacterium]|nr:Zn-ribbon domain-containing OB-fold protein [Acidimicrobiia bacterium]